MEKLKRYVIFIVGLFVNSLGVSLITKGNLGTSPISSIPYVLSLNFPFTLGEFTIFFSLFLIFLQIVILRKDFKLENILQIPVSIAFGYFIDLCMMLLWFVQPQMYVAKVAYLLMGCVILGIGVYMEMLADVVMLPGESFVRAVVFRWKTEFGVTKVGFDVTMTVTAAVLSFVFQRQLAGVREGTIIAAILVGFIARWIGKKLDFLPQKLFPAAFAQQELPEEGEISPWCITIDRQYGSGGREMGKRLAEKLGCPFYDKDIIQMAAGSTGYTPEYISKREENMSSSLLYHLVTEMYAYADKAEAPEDAIYEAECKVIKQAAAKGNCVIVGRCAGQVLKDHPKCLRLYLHAPVEYRVKRLMETEGLGEKEARKKISQVDRRRGEYHRYYTHCIWGMSSNYHLCIDTSLGMDKVEEMVLSLQKTCSGVCAE